MKRIAITGATGFLGAAIARKLLERGDRVVALSRTPGRPQRLQGLPIEWRPSTQEGLVAALDAGTIDAVIHTACCYGRSGETPSALVEANLLQPLRLAEVVGTRIRSWINIGTSLPPHVSVYANSKFQFDEWLRQLPVECLAPRVLVQMEHMYGPGDDSNKFVTRIIRACIAGEDIPLTSGQQERDFVHIDDAVRGILRLVDFKSTSGYAVFPIGSGSTVSIRSIVERIQALTGGRARLKFDAIPLRQYEPKRSCADIRAMAQLGWQPTVELENGLVELVEEESRLVGALK